ncbi:hypothetical protein BGX24_010393, partial [Mortierella sp. AD032]
MESLALSGHLGSQDVESMGDDKSVSSIPIRRRNKFLSLFRSSSSELKVKIKPQSSSPKAATHCQSSTSTTASVHRLTTVSTHHNIQAEHAVASTTVQIPISTPEPSTLLFNLYMDIFTQNVNKPAVFVSLPELGTRISTTPQLVLCIALLLKSSDAGEQQPNPFEKLPFETTSKLAWVKAMKQDPIEQEHIRWLGTCMVGEFAKDALKDSTEIAEMVLLGLVLDRETYRKLLSCAIAAFEQATLLDVNYLQG